MPVAFITTYTYEALSPRHIRLLELTTNNTVHDSVPKLGYRMVHLELLAIGPVPAFDAVSYTWGDHAKVSTLQIQDAVGHITLTANLSEPLPHVSEQSSTGRLWIDQLCINQADDTEKSVQVGLMAEIYSKANKMLLSGLVQRMRAQTCARSGWRR